MRARPFSRATACFAAICAGLLIGAVWTFITDSGEIQHANWVRISLYAIGGQLAAAVIWRARSATGKGRFLIALAGASVTVVGLMADTAFKTPTGSSPLLLSLLATFVAFVFNTLTWGVLAWLVYSVVALVRHVFNRRDDVVFETSGADSRTHPSS